MPKKNESEKTEPERTEPEKTENDKTGYPQYFSALLTGKRLLCGDIVAELMMQKISVKKLYTDFFQRSLYQVGELWEHNKISVAAEHMATSMTEGLMNRIYPDIVSAKRIGKKALISSVENEQHQVGAKMVADIFEMNGWDAVYLGANTPTHELIRFAEEIKPDIIGLSLSVWFHMEYLEKMIKAIREKFPNLRILIGGQAFRNGKAPWLNDYPKVSFIDSLDGLEKMIQGGEL